MVTPAQRLVDLESSAWQFDKHLERIEINIADLQEKAGQHAIALSATMQDLRDLRIDVGQMTNVLEGHTAILNAIAQHFGIEVATEVPAVA
jgi:hypothetical protein